MHMSGASASPSSVAKTGANGDELLFAALFGGATGEISTDDDNGDAAVLAGVFAVQTTEQDDPENPPQDALLAMIAALQAAKNFDQKQAGRQMAKQMIRHRKIAIPQARVTKPTHWRI